MKQNSSDFALNVFITGIGLQEDYRNDLIAHLKNHNIKASGTESIHQLEKLLKQARERKPHGR